METSNSALKDRFAKYLGIEIISAGKDFSKVKLMLKPEFINGAGFVQGGVLFTLADYAFALSVNFQDAGLAVNANINFIKTVSLEDKEIYAESKLISRTRKLGTYQINVLNKANVILAQAMSIAYFKD